MGIFSTLLPAIGTFLGGPVGGAIGSVVGAAISGGASYMGATATNRSNQSIASNANVFNAEQAQKANIFTADQTAKARSSTEGMSARAITASREMQDKALQHSTHQFNSAQAYNREMSNTSFQRGVKDMKAAGINPIIAFNKGGASTPTSSPGPAPTGSGTAGSGSAGTGQSARATTIAKLDAVNAGVNSARNIVELSNLIKNSKEQRRLIDANVKLTRQKRELVHNESEKVHIQAKREHLNYDADKKYGVSKTGKDLNSYERMIKRAWEMISPSSASAKEMAK